jgi:hypothetical protein
LIDDSCVKLSEHTFYKVEKRRSVKTKAHKTGDKIATQQKRKIDSREREREREGTRRNREKREERKILGELTL